MNNLENKAVFYHNSKSKYTHHSQAIVSFYAWRSISHISKRLSIVFAFVMIESKISDSTAEAHHNYTLDFLNAFGVVFLIP